MKTVLSYFVLFICTGFAFGCSSKELNYSVDTKYGELKFSIQDTNTIKDLLDLCDKEIPKISFELDLNFKKSLIVEIYANQEEYNKAIINPDFKDSPAISGDNTIQMVSPLSRLKVEEKIGKIEYHDRLYFLIHEYTHLLIDGLDNPPPICIDEGIASYYSSYSFYTNMINKYFKKIPSIPTIEQLINNYNNIPASDVFSFLLIDFVVNTKGKDILKKILREPNILIELNNQWVEYLRMKYQ